MLAALLSMLRDHLKIFILDAISTYFMFLCA